MTNLLVLQRRRCRLIPDSLGCDHAVCVRMRQRAAGASGITTAVDDLIYPVFVREGSGVQEAVGSMPGVIVIPPTP